MNRARLTSSVGMLGVLNAARLLLTLTISISLLGVNDENDQVQAMVRYGTNDSISIGSDCHSSILHVSLVYVCHS